MKPGEQFDGFSEDMMNSHLLPGGLEIDHVRGEYPAMDEAREPAYFRHMMSINELRAKYPGQNLLLIIHAKTFHTFGWTLDEQYTSIAYCASMTAATRLDTQLMSGTGIPTPRCNIK